VAITKIIVLTSGGLRSLVATAVVLSWPEPATVSLLHVVEPEAAGDRALQHAKQQAGYFGNRTLEVIEQPVVSIGAGGRAQSEQSIEMTLHTSRLLMLALARAAVNSATTMIWPASFNGDVSAIARASEQALLARHLASTELASPALIELPLVEFDDRQIVELGAALDVPWELARSCELDGDDACGQCPRCRRRRAAFEAACIDDPLLEPAAAKR